MTSPGAPKDDTTKAGETPAAYEDNGGAPFVYFDITSAHGTMNGAVQIELASRVMTPEPAGGVEIRFRASGHLRCTPAAAIQLRDSLNAALAMLEKMQEQPAAARNTLN